MLFPLCQDLNADLNADFKARKPTGPLAIARNSGSMLDPSAAFPTQLEPFYSQALPLYRGVFGWLASVDLTANFPSRRWSRMDVDIGFVLLNEIDENPDSLSLTSLRNR